MVSKESAVKKYIVTLSDEEREQLTALIHSGKHPAQKLLKARILLKADASQCTACGFWDTGLNPTQRRRQFEAVCGGIGLV